MTSPLLTKRQRRSSEKKPMCVCEEAPRETTSSANLLGDFYGIVGPNILKSSMSLTRMKAKQMGSRNLSQ